MYGDVWAAYEQLRHPSHTHGAAPVFSPPPVTPATADSSPASVHPSSVPAYSSFRSYLPAVSPIQCPTRRSAVGCDHVRAASRDFLDGEEEEDEIPSSSSHLMARVREQMSRGPRWQRVLKLLAFAALFLNPCSPLFYLLLVGVVFCVFLVVLVLLFLNPLIYSLLLLGGGGLISVVVLLNPLLPGFYLVTVPLCVWGIYEAYLFLHIRIGRAFTTVRKAVVRHIAAALSPLLAPRGKKHDPSSESPSSFFALVSSAGASAWHVLQKCRRPGQHQSPVQRSAGAGAAGDEGEPIASDGRPVKRGETAGGPGHQRTASLTPKMSTVRRTANQGDSSAGLRVRQQQGQGQGSGNKAAFPSVVHLPSRSQRFNSDSGMVLTSLQRRQQTFPPEQVQPFYSVTTANRERLRNLQTSPVATARQPHRSKLKERYHLSLQDDRTIRRASEEDSGADSAGGPD